MPQCCYQDCQERADAWDTDKGWAENSVYYTCHKHERVIEDIMDGLCVAVPVETAVLLEADIDWEAVPLPFFRRTRHDGHACRLIEGLDSRYVYCRQCGYAEAA